MKELSIEEKAKRYDEAIERARIWYDINTNEGYRSIFEGIFPELKESKDERIRKELIEFFTFEHWDGEAPFSVESARERIAWIEKQGERKPVVDDKDAEKASEEYRNFRMSCGIKDPVMLNEIEEAYYEGAIRKQKPAAWSEEDENIKEDIILNLQENHKNKYINERTYLDEINWLKSLKDRYTWKPSDKQMEYLAKAITTLGDEGDCKTALILNDLRFELKKLKGE